MVSMTDVEHRRGLEMRQKKILRGEEGSHGEVEEEDGGKTSGVQT